MSKKHFIALAAVLKNNRPENSPNRLAQWRIDVAAIADVCAQHNPQFDKGKFLGACGAD